MLNELFLKVFLVAGPMYIANACALIFSGNTPVDLGLKFFDGKRLLGDGKTWQGTVAGIFFGALGALIVQISLPDYALLLTDNYSLFGLLVATGAITGDIIASFFKRRIGIKRGAALFVVDQLDFIAGGILAGLVLYVPGLLEIAIIVAITLLAHKISNIIAFKIKMKRVPW